MNPRYFSKYSRLYKVSAPIHNDSRINNLRCKSEQSTIKNCIFFTIAYF